MVRGRAGRAPGKRERSRARIIEAARSLFAEHGFESVSMDDVAAEAAVSRTTVFNHFPSKHALLEGVTERILERYEELLAQSVRSTRTTVVDRVRRLFRDMGRGVANASRLHRAVFREISRVMLTPDEPSRAFVIRREAIERLTQLMTQGQAAGELRTDVMAQHLASAFDSLVFGTVTFWMMEPSDSLQARMKLAAELFLDMAASPGGPRGRQPRSAGPDS